MSAPRRGCSLTRELAIKPPAPAGITVLSAVGDSGEGAVIGTIVGGVAGLGVGAFGSVSERDEELASACVTRATCWTPREHACQCPYSPEHGVSHCISLMASTIRGHPAHGPRLTRSCGAYSDTILNRLTALVIQLPSY